MNQWDLYVDGQAIDIKNSFKKIDDKSYAIFREMMQILDLGILDIDTLQYHPRVFIASAMYLILSLHYDILTLEGIVSRVPYYSDYLEPNDFNSTFSMFLEQSFSFELSELLPTIQYVSSLFKLPFVYDLPTINSKHQNMDDNYEEFISYQTHNRNQLEFITKRMNCKIN